MISVLGLDLGTTWGWARVTVTDFHDDRWVWTWGEEAAPRAELGFSSPGLLFANFARWLQGELPNTDAVTWEQVPFATGKGGNYIKGQEALLLAHLGTTPGVHWQPYDVQALKTFATGRGNASKASMIDTIPDAWRTRFHGAKDWDGRTRLTDNQADALWVTLMMVEHMLALRVGK